MVVTSYGNTSVSVPDAHLPEPYNTHFRECYEVWSKNRGRNTTLRDYYEGNNKLKNIGIAIPEELADLRAIVGWPRKAVDELAKCSHFDGYTHPDGADELNEIMRQNSFSSKYRKLNKSELVQGLSFCTVTRGERDEPPTRVRSYSAVNAACTWDYRLERVRCGITVHDVDKNGIPTRYELYEDDCIIEIERIDKYGSLVFPSNVQQWTYTIYPQPMGRPQIEPLVYDADSDYPLGHSRITKAVMDITDRAVRESVRTELASEFAATPQKYLLGGTKKDKEAAMREGTRWEMYIGSVMWFTKDRDGDVPQYGQLPQVSMQPHMDYFEHLAEEFAAETDIPIDALIRSKTYTSSESAQANRDALVQIAEVMNEDNRQHLTEIGKMALAVKRKTSIDGIEDGIVPIFRNPSRPSAAAQADWITKMCATFPWMAETEVALEKAGFTEDERVRLMSDKRRIQARESVEKLKLAMRQQQPMDNESGNGGEEQQQEDAEQAEGGEAEDVEGGGSE